MKIFIIYLLQINPFTARNTPDVPVADAHVPERINRFITPV